MNPNIYPRGYNRSHSSYGKHSSFCSDQSPAETGLSYEKYVAEYYLSKAKGTIVVHQGVILGKMDSGIDLVVITADSTYLVQCKCYSNHSELHSNYVSQLSGDANVFTHKFPEAVNIQSVLVASCSFASDAQESASVNNVKLVHLPMRSLSPYRQDMSGYLDKAASDYESFLRSIINAKQHPETAAPEQLALLEDLISKKPEQPAPLANQTPEKPEQPALPANQTLEEAEQSAPSVNQTPEETEQSAAVHKTTMPEQNTKYSSLLSRWLWEFFRFPLLLIVAIITFSSLACFIPGIALFLLWLKINKWFMNIDDKGYRKK